MEEWREIAGFPGYEVSDLGRVRSWKPAGGRRPARSEPRPLTLSHSNGYPHAALFNAAGKVVRCRVPALVLEAFVGPRPAGSVARHILTNDRSDCRLANLEWGTPAQNYADRDRHGGTARGTRNYNATITEAVAADIFLSDGCKYCVAKRFNVSPRIVSDIRKGKTWTHVTNPLKGAAE